MNLDYCQHIDDFLNNDIEPCTVTDWEDHIATCRSCNETVNEYRELQNHLKKAWSMVRPANTDISPLTKATSSQKLRKKLRKNNDVVLAHWSWVVVPVLIVSIFLGIVFSYLPQQPGVAERDPIDVPVVVKNPNSFAAEVKSRDKENRDFVETIASTNEFTLVKYHQGIDLKSVSKMEMSVH